MAVVWSITIQISDSGVENEPIRKVVINNCVSGIPGCPTY